MSRTIFPKGFILFALIGTSLFLNSCGYIMLSRQTKFVPQTEDVTVSIADKEEGPYEVVSSEKLKIKLNHRKKQYWVKQEKEAHVTKVEEITRTSSNKLKKLDLALAISSTVASSIFVPVHFIQGGNGIFGSGRSPSLAQKVILFTNLGVGLASWGAIIPAPGRLYPKKVELAKLVEILTKDTNQLFLTSGKSEFKLKKRGVRVRDYPSMKQFNNGYGYESRDTAENFEFVEKLKLYDDIADMLNAAEYGIDSTTAELSNTLKLDSWVKSVVFMTADDKLRCELRTTWALETLDELQYLYDRRFSGNSEWLPFKEDMLDEDDQEMIIKQALVDAMDASLKKFLAMDTIQSILSAPVPIPLQEEKVLTLSTGNIFAKSVSDAVKSVITVQTNKGHGSGCIITSDGYIITNAHVVKDDTTDLKAIMTDDVEKTIPLKFIRMNEAIDLALLKIDTTGLTPLKLCNKDQIETGADAYAVGTPADIDLGQTVTRGIVSGKRKFGGHHLIQTDVAISPGNSGGALIRPDALLIGIVTSEMKSRRIDDIGFVIPAPIIESALKIILTE